MCNITVSIVVPCFNVEKYIEAGLKSIARQTYHCFEVIVVNDGSTDQTEKICRRIVDDDSRFRYIYQKNAGVYAARNRGIVEAKGQYVLFMDGDDQLPPDALVKLVNEAKSEPDIVCGDAFVFDEFHESEYFFFKEPFVAKDDKDKLCLFYQIFDISIGQPNKEVITGIGVPWAKLYKRNLFENGLTFPPLRRMQDNVFNANAFAEAHSIKYIHECVYKYRLDHIRSHSRKNMRDSYVEVLKARKIFFNTYPIYYEWLKKEYSIETLFYYFNVIRFYVRTKSRKDAIKAIKGLNDFYPFLETTRKIKVPFRYELIRCLGLHNHSNLLYCLALVGNR